jgi:fatty acid desaturase
MMSLVLSEPWAGKIEEEAALEHFRLQNPDLFQKSDRALYLHLGWVLTLLLIGTAAVIQTPFLWMKVPGGVCNALLWFSLINVTIRHHHTHHNAAESQAAGKFLNILYLLAVPNAPRRRNRTKTYHFPSWLNYLLGGEISGHFLHHLFPGIPYYHVERARRRFMQDPGLSKLFVTY